MIGAQFEFLYWFKYKNIGHYDFIKWFKEFFNFKIFFILKLGHYDFLKMLNTILDYLCIDIITMYENNIKQHFIEYIERYVNVV